jgi:hypothetical protein
MAPDTIDWGFFAICRSPPYEGGHQPTGGTVVARHNTRRLLPCMLARSAW